VVPSQDQPSERADRGALVSQLSREIVRLHARLYGRGPTKARSYLHREYAFCVLEEIFTTAERTLVETGSGAHVQDTRQRFQEAVEPEFRQIVEEITGRKVRVFLSQVNVDADLAVEFFLFEPEPEAEPEPESREEEENG
jgi:uncharacterized protein YbcI